MTAYTAFASPPEGVKRDTPRYDNAENAVEAIVAQYPGKTVFIDFWATWCGPCLRAMITIEPLLPWMEKNDIVRVYISAPSSNRAQWEAVTGDIGGNHYWFTEDEWRAVCNKFEITAIPSYQIYNKKGEKTLQQRAYPGNDRMKAELEKAL